MNIESRLSKLEEKRDSDNTCECQNETITEMRTAADRDKKIERVYCPRCKSEHRQIIIQTVPGASPQMPSGVTQATFNVHTKLDADLG
jgi:hypothetical protein